MSEDDIAQFLQDTPDFFERHAAVLANVQLSNPHGQRVVSLLERQAQMLREKIRQLELKNADMVRHGQENVVIAQHLHTWAWQLFMVQSAVDLPGALVQSLRTEFALPQATVRLWGLYSAWAGEPFAQAVSEPVQAYAQSLTQPYCGSATGQEAVQWLNDPQAAASVALLPLRPSAQEPAFGLLVLASDDPQRFRAHMGTDFLQRIAELASAALTRLLP